MKLNFPFPSQQPAHTIRAPRLVHYRLIRLCNKHFYFSITRVNLAVDAAICKLCLRKTTQHSNLGTTKTSMRLPCRRRDDATLSYLIAATLSLLSLICEIDSERRAQIDSEHKLNWTEKTGREFQNDLGTWESEINSLSSCYRRPGTTWWNFKLTFGIIIIDIHISARGAENEGMLNETTLIADETYLFMIEKWKLTFFTKRWQNSQLFPRLQLFFPIIIESWHSVVVSCSLIEWSVEPANNRAHLIALMIVMFEL